MALNKRKILDTARKFAQKGAKAKALKEYNKLLQADPRDAKLLLEVGDAYRRWGQAEEAIAQYSKVAQQYRQDGFDARAVAVFKQILNLDPKHHAAYVSLAELYQRMGLDSEAIGALQTAADGYHKEGRKGEALDLLRQMAALDPTNTTSRLKVAELLRQEGMTTEALAEYEAVAEELESQQDRDQLITVLERVLEIKGDHLGALTRLVRTLMANGELGRAEPLAVRALNVSQDPDQYELLTELYAQMGDEAKLADATRGLAKVYRDRGDEEKARELMQRLPVAEVGSSSRLAVDVSEVGEPELGDEELLAEEPFLTLSNDGMAPDLSSPDVAKPVDLDLTLGADEEIELEAPSVEAPAPPPAKTEPTVLPEGDPDQLLAEASVYLRYGKREQAIASLRGVLAQDPDHRGALDKLGEAYADDGQQAEAIAAWSRAAEQTRLAGDAEALSALKDRIAALDPAAAARIGDVEAAPAPPPEVELDLDVAVDLDLDTAIGEVAASETQSGLDFGGGEDDFEIELDDDSMSFGPDEPSSAADDSIDQTEPARAGADDDSVFEFEIDEDTFDDGLSEEPGNAELEFELDANELTTPPTQTDSGQGTDATARINEEVEEAEFYIAQEMYDEAQTILERVLASAPGHPSAMLRLGEVEAARAALSGAAAEVPASDSHSTEPLQAADDDGLGDSVEELDIDLDAEIEAAADDAESGPVDLNADVELDLAGDTTDGFPSEEDDTARTEDATPPIPEPQPTPVAAKPVAAPAAAMDPGETFDLREALADVLTEDGPTASEDQTAGVLSTVEDGFESIFSDFKKGVSATLEEGDYDTRYDLGIAYREMELYEDAIGEFRVCLDSPTRRFDSLYLMGLCARDLSRFQDAVNHLEQALALPETPENRTPGVYFDLSIAQEGLGDSERACASLRRVIELEPGFPGAADRLAALESGQAGAPQLAGSGDGFESFDELFTDEGDEDGDEAIAEAVPVESFESFDDVVSEAEAVLEEAELIEDGPDDNSQSGRKGGRKKISFV